MITYFRTALLGLVATVGFLTTACEKQDVTSEQLTVQTRQSAHDDLVSTMTSDPLVQDFILANLKFTQGFDNWFNSLPKQQQAAFHAGMEQAMKQGTPLPATPYLSEAEAQKQHADQVERAAAIKQKYGSLNSLEQQEQFVVKKAVSDAIIAQYYGGDVPQEGAGGGGTCYDSYNVCSWTCYDNGGGGRCYDACWAAYQYCASFP